MGTEVVAGLNVSRETFDRLKHLESLLVKWNPRINLVAKSTINDAWDRHILDSIPVFSAVSGAGRWIDIGSGGGFPGLVIAILNAEKQNFEITMIESDQRKCAFLRTVIRETGVQADVISKRIEAVEPMQADILSARALADLNLLLEFSERHLGSSGTALFPKGLNWKKEVLAAQESWSFDYEALRSETQEGAVILKIREIKRV